MIDSGHSTILDTKEARIQRLKKRTLESAKFFDDSRKCWLITLTYRCTVEEEQTHLTKARALFFRWYARNHPAAPKPRMVWVRELTKKGKLHYHIVMTGDYPGKWDKLGLWPYGMTQVKNIKTSDTNSSTIIALRYITKYISKPDSKIDRRFKSWRSYGFAGFSMDEKKLVTYSLLPAWMKTFKVDDFLSPSRRLLKKGFKLISGWVYKGRVKRKEGLLKGTIIEGFVELVFTGYCEISSGRSQYLQAVAGVSEAPGRGGACMLL